MLEIGKNLYVTDQGLVLRKIKIEDDPSGSYLRELQSSIFNHPNLETPLDIKVKDGHVYLFYQQALGNMTKYETEDEKMKILFQVLQALTFLHKHKFVHRQIHPKNILVFKNGGKLSNFQEFGIRGLNYIPSMPFKPPELYFHNAYEPPADMWAFGIVLYWALFKQLPFRDERDIFRALGTPDLKWMKMYSGKNHIPYAVHTKKEFINTENKVLKNLIGMCLTLDPKQRITAEQALNHSMWDSFKGKRHLGKIKKIPVVPKIGLAPYSIIRQHLVDQSLKDIGEEYAERETVLLAILTFDRVQKHFKKYYYDQFEDLDVSAVHSSFCASFCIAKKIMETKGNILMRCNEKIVRLYEQKILNVLSFALYPHMVVKKENVNFDRIIRTSNWFK
jgi:serine/threonine protein kinase